MIIPTPDFDQLFAIDGIPFGLKMCQYIQREFADILIPNTVFVESEAGWEVVARLPFPAVESTESQKNAA